MSNTPRPPLLSVEKLVDEFCEVHPFHAQLYAKQSACWVRDHYEDLITDGKLRVVEEVELDESGHCLHCGYDVTDRSEPRSPEVPPYCHGCGGKIKR